MSDANPHAVRQTRDGHWQISLMDSAMWHTCHNELDARYIANGLHLAAAVTRGEQHGRETAEELDEAAGVLQRNLGNNWAEGTLNAAATQARGATRPSFLRTPSAANPVLLAAATLPAPFSRDPKVRRGERVPAVPRPPFWPCQVNSGSLCGRVMSQRFISDVPES
jgi:hypothetical protein